MTPMNNEKHEQVNGELNNDPKEAAESIDGGGGDAGMTPVDGHCTRNRAAAAVAHILVTGV